MGVVFPEPNYFCGFNIRTKIVEIGSVAADYLF
jgi:hypothetical protein